MGDSRDLTEEVAMAIFESLGGADATLSERMATAEKLISDQKVDLDKLKAKLQSLSAISEEKEETMQSLK